MEGTTEETTTTADSAHALGPTFALDAWRGRRAVVLGLGRFGGGLGAARSLAAVGADVLVVDRAGPDELADAVDALRRARDTGLKLDWHLGGDPADRKSQEDVVGSSVGSVGSVGKRGLS